MQPVKNNPTTKTEEEVKKLVIKNEKPETQDKVQQVAQKQRKPCPACGLG